MRYANYQTAKSNTQLFESLLSKDHPMIIENDELRKIAGGDPTEAQVDDLMDKLFTTTPIFVEVSGGVGTTLWDQFKLQVKDLARTNIGFTMLTALDGLNTQVSISPVDPFPNQDGGAAWERNLTGGPAGGKISIGSIFTDFSGNYWSRMADNFDGIAHEIFHAYVYLKTGLWNPTSPNVEMDAYLFGMLADAEMDGRRGLDGTNYNAGGLNMSYVENNLSITPWAVNPSASTQDKLNYQDAVYEIFHNGNFTEANYNTMANLWGTTSYAGDAQQTTGDPLYGSAFETSIIKDLWTNSYSQSTYFASSPPLFLQSDPIQNPPPGGGGGGGGFDPYANGWTWDPNMGQYGGWQSSSYFVDFYYSTGGQGTSGGFDWNSFWMWLDDWSGTNWGIVGDVFWAPAETEEVLA